MSEKARIQADNELLAPKEGKKVDDSEFAGKEATAVQVDGEYFGLGGLKKPRKKNKEKKEKEVLVPSFRVSNPNPSNDRDRENRGKDRRDGRRGDRRGRGGDNRRGGGRDGGGKKAQETAVNVADTSAFPAL